MSQHGAGVDLETSLGYLLKQASSALRAAMEEALQPLGMSVTRYSCLELLAQRPGSSNSELARGAFVTRQSMNVLLQAIRARGLELTGVTEAEQSWAFQILERMIHALRPGDDEAGPTPVREGRPAGRGQRDASVHQDRS